MSEDTLLRPLVQSLSSAVAVADPADWHVHFENARFFQLFALSEDGDETAASRIPGFNPGRAAERLAAGRPYSFDVKVEVNGRDTPLEVTVRPFTASDDVLALIEAVDVSKQREAEYMLQSYSEMVEKNTRELSREKERVEKLLLNIMPRSVYEEMKDYGSATPQRFDDVTIMILDFVNFTEMAVSQEPGQLIAELNDIFTAFDRMVDMFDCERIKTIGDGYLAVSGLPQPSAEHAKNIARVALRIRRYLERRNRAHSEPWRCRIGINTGPVIGSIVGIQKYVYDIFGPGVNLAARMEEQSEPMKITLCEETQRLLRDEFIFEERGEMEIKGFGPKKLYYLEGEHDA